MQEKPDLNKMLLPELREYAATLNIKGISTMRKPELLRQINEKLSGIIPTEEKSSSVVELFSNDAIISDEKPFVSDNHETEQKRKRIEGK